MVEHNAMDIGFDDSSLSRYFQPCKIKLVLTEHHRF